MKLVIFAIGKPRLSWAREAVNEYARRLAHVQRSELRFLKASTPARESRDLILASQGACRIALDERGELFSTGTLAERLDAWRSHGPQQVAFLIGGADGHTPALRSSADFLWALSPLTFQHELALVTLLEQLYRACCILEGHPYHRAG